MKAKHFSIGHTDRPENNHYNTLANVSFGYKGNPLKLKAKLNEDRLKDSTACHFHMGSSPP
jgi:hypothetical protein